VAPRVPNTPRTPASTTWPGGASATLGAETQLLRGADGALRTGDPAHALELLDEHAVAFPDGVLAEERSAERVTTLCALGRVADARVEAARFLATRPDSPLAKVVRRSCGADDKTESPAPLP
jgi:hypothetical protein